MQRSLDSRSLAQRALELELQNTRKKVAYVRSVRRYVILGPGIEVLLAAFYRRRHALILRLQVPPRFVVFPRSDLPGKNLPSPLVDRKSEGQESDLVERHLQQVTDVGALRRNIVQ